MFSKYSRMKFLLWTILPISVYGLLAILLEDFFYDLDSDLSQIIFWMSLGFLFLNFIWAIFMRGIDIGLHPFSSVLIMTLTIIGITFPLYFNSDFFFIPFTLFLLFYLLMPRSKKYKEVEIFSKYSRMKFLLWAILPISVYGLLAILLEDFFYDLDGSLLEIIFWISLGFLFLNLIWAIFMRGIDIGLHPFFSVLIMTLTIGITFTLIDGYNDFLLIPFIIFLLFYLLMPSSKKYMDEKKIKSFKTPKKKIKSFKTPKKKSTRIINLDYLLILVPLGAFVMAIIPGIMVSLSDNSILDIEAFFEGLGIGFVLFLIYGLFMMLIGLIKKLNTENKVWLVSSLIPFLFITSFIIWRLMTSDDSSEFFLPFYIFLPLLIIPKLAFIIKNYWNQGKKVKIILIGFVSVILVFGLTYILTIPLTQQQAIEYLEKDGNFRYIPLKFQEDKEVVLVAVNQNYFALEYASDTLKNDKEVVLAAVNKYGSALEYASDTLKNDKEVVLAAVNKYGSALKYASDTLKNDKEVVLVAVNKSGFALEYASDTLKNDKEVVLAAVNESGFALEYASDRLKNDSDMLEAVKKLSTK